MIALTIVYAVAISLPLAALGVLVEHIAALGRRPRRWAWAATLASVVALTALMPWRVLPADQPSLTAESGRAPGRVPVAAPAAPAAVVMPEWREWRARLNDRTAVLLRAAARGDEWCRWAWPLSSAGILLIYALGRRTLGHRRRTWREALIQHHQVFVAPDDGPAVVGVHAPRIVIPEWALELEPRALSLMLRHEHEHQRARDPLLIHLAGLTLVLMPWNPLVWWMLSRLRLAVELDCDARVLETAREHSRTASSDLSIYGDLLLAVVTRRSSRRALVAPAMLEHPSTLKRRITAMYSNRARHIGPRVAVASGAALVILASTLVVRLPPVSAQSKETPGSTSRLAGPATAPAFVAPTAAAAKTLIAKAAPDLLAKAESTAVTVGSRTQRQELLNVVLVLDSSGNVIGTQTTQVLEMLIQVVRPPATEPQLTEAQARERQERRLAGQNEARMIGRAEKTEAPASPSLEDEARARRAAAEQAAKELAAHLISIDAVHYNAGEISDRPVTVYFITTNGSGNTAK